MKKNDEVINPVRNRWGKKFLYVTAIACYFVLFSEAVLSSKYYCAIGPEKANQDTINNVAARMETMPVPRGEKDDSADDPAIWIHPKKPDQSRIIGTDKKGGLAVYNLNGDQLFYYADGEMNNVDLRYGFALTKEKTDILAVSNRTSNSINLYRINKNGSLEKVHQRELKTEMKDEVYGLCMFKSPKSGKYYVFMNNKEGEVEQWELFAIGNQVDGRIVRKLKLSGQVEGMVADDEAATLFVGEEKTGIWKFSAEPDNSVEGTLLAQSSETDNKNILFDIEGLAIYYLARGNGYLIASSQGNDSYAVFRRESPYDYLGSFRIADGAIDGVEGTDGLDVTSIPLGKIFPNGILVVQDGSNKNEGQPAPQNFKLVSWDSVAGKFTPPLK